MSCDPIKLIFKESEVEIKFLNSDFLSSNIPPSAPTGLTEDAVGSTTIDISWSANAEGDLDGYNVYVDGSKDNGSLVNGTSYQITGLSSETPYDIYITAVDTSGLESDPSATITSTTTAAPQNNVSILHSGTQSWLFATNIAAGGPLDITGDLTMMGRMKPDVGCRSYLFYYGDGSDNRQYTIFYDDDAPRIRIHTQGGNKDFALGSKLSDDTWHHVAVVVSGGTIEVFVDFSSIGTLSGTITKGSVSNSSNNFFIGARTNFVFPWDGHTDELSVWNTGLSLSQIQTYAGDLLAGNETNLQGYWNAEDQAASLTDITGNQDLLLGGGISYDTNDTPAL